MGVLCGFCKVFWSLSCLFPQSTSVCRNFKTFDWFRNFKTFDWFQPLKNDTENLQDIVHNDGYQNNLKIFTFSIKSVCWQQVVTPMYKEYV